MKIEDRKELAEVLRNLAVLIEEDTRISSHAPVEVANEARILVNREAAKYRRWADELLAENNREANKPKQLFVDPTSWKLADQLHAAGYDDCNHGKDHDPRGCEEWQRVVDCFESLADKVNGAREASQSPVAEPAPQEKRVPKVGDTVWCFICQSDWEGYWPAVVAQPMPGDPACSVRVTFFNFGTGPTTVLRRIENLRLTDPNLEQAGSPK